jgi:hypothetical protein
MTAGPGDAPPDERGEQGWDDSVLVWNATVARIAAPVPEPDPAEQVARRSRRDAAPGSIPARHVAGAPGAGEGARGPLPDEPA